MSKNIWENIWEIVAPYFYGAATSIGMYLLLSYPTHQLFELYLENANFFSIGTITLIIVLTAGLIGAGILILFRTRRKHVHLYYDQLAKRHIFCWDGQYSNDRRYILSPFYIKYNIPEIMIGLVLVCLVAILAITIVLMVIIILHWVPSAKQIIIWIVFAVSGIGGHIYFKLRIRHFSSRSDKISYYLGVFTGPVTIASLLLP